MTNVSTCLQFDVCITCLQFDNCIKCHMPKPLLFSLSNDHSSSSRVVSGMKEADHCSNSCLQGEHARDPVSSHFPGYGGHPFGWKSISWTRLGQAASWALFIDSYCTILLDCTCLQWISWQNFWLTAAALYFWLYMSAMNKPTELWLTAAALYFLTVHLQWISWQSFLLTTTALYLLTVHVCNEQADRSLWPICISYII